MIFCSRGFCKVGGILRRHVASLGTRGLFRAGGPGHWLTFWSASPQRHGAVQCSLCCRASKISKCRHPAACPARSVLGLRAGRGAGLQGRRRADAAPCSRPSRPSAAGSERDDGLVCVEGEGGVEGRSSGPVSEARDALGRLAAPQPSRSANTIYRRFSSVFERTAVRVPARCHFLPPSSPGFAPSGR